MTLNRIHGHRRSIRLPHHDYTAPAVYFITFNTRNRQQLLGKIRDGRMELNAFGRIVLEEWRKIAAVRPNILLDQFVIMPDHVHGILIFKAAAEANATGDPQPKKNRTLIPGSLGAVIGQLKSISTKRINELRGTPGVSIWQRDYWESIVRGRSDLNRIRRYVRNNPLRWRQRSGSCGTSNCPAVPGTLPFSRS